jgi:hypothetical protein
MAHHSPVTPVAGVRPAVHDRHPFVCDPVVRVTAGAPRPDDLPSFRGNRPAAFALAISTVVLTADIVVRPLLTPGIPTHPALQWGAVGVMAATALGVARGQRVSRLVARGIGYVYGIGSLFTLSRFVNAGATANWWEAGVWAVTAAALGFMLDRLGWLGDEA